MKKNLNLLVILLLASISSCLAQQMTESNLFEWSNGSVVPNSAFIEIDDQPSLALLTSMGYSANTYHSFSISTSNNRYSCMVHIKGEGDENTDSHLYDLFEITDNSGSTIYKRFGEDPLTTTCLISGDPNDNDYFKKIPLDENSYALIFAGWYYGYEENPGEMIIIVISKNVATLVFDSRAVAISPTMFTFPNYYCQECLYQSEQSFEICPRCGSHRVNSDYFSLEFVKDGTGFSNIDGNIEITQAKLAERIKYRLYKDGNILKIVQWQ